MSSIISQLQDAPMPEDETKELRAALDEAIAERDVLEKRLKSVGVFDIDE